MRRPKSVIGLLGALLLAVPSGAWAEEDVVKQLQAALDKKISASEADEVLLKDLPEVLEKYLPPGTQVKVGGDWFSTTEFRRLRGLRVGAALELAEDTLPGARVVVRGYGILITTEDKVPPRGIPLHDFWKGASPGAREEIAALKKQLAERKDLVERQAAAAGQAQAEAVRLREQLEKAQEAVKKEKDRADGHEAVNKALLEEAKLRQAESEQLREQVKKLDEELRQRALELEKLKGARGELKKPPAERNPPKVAIEGTVKAVEAGTGLVEVSVGADAGLEVGHTLEVFRLDSPRYLGTLRIVKVEKDRAVGRFEGGSTDQIQIGDRVASRILGK